MNNSSRDSREHRGNRSGSRRVRNARPELITAARILRHHQTDAESILWDALRGRRQGSVKFRRQYAVGRFILDFCAPEYKLIVELDGKIHAAHQAEDAARSDCLARYGWRVLRFTNDDVFQRLPVVLETITRSITDQHRCNVDEQHRG